MRKITNRCLIMLSLFILTFCVSASAADTGLNKTKLALTVGQTSTLKVTGASTGVKWSSSNTKVATVSKTGKVKAKKAGTATITATVNKQKYTCKVTVSKKTVLVSKVKLNKSKVTIYKGKTYKLKATVSPSKAANKKVSWTSSNPDIATVSSSGTVTAKKNGTVTITATAKDGSGKKRTCKVTVKTKTVKAKKVSLNKTKLTLSLGNTYTLKATVSPSDTTNKNVTWKSSNTKVATVSKDGLVTAKKAGSAKITATTADGSKKKATCTITVKNIPVQKLTITGVNESLTEGSSMQLKLTVSPSNANNGFKWTSSNTNVATVSQSGLVTAKAAGTTKITVTAQDGSKATMSIWVQVSKKESSGSNTGTSSGNTSTGSETDTTETVSKTVTGITATCSLSEVFSISEVTTDHLTVYEHYLDGSKALLTSYKVSGVYSSADGGYVYTITKTGTSFSTKVYVKLKKTESEETESATVTLTDIEATCLLDEVASGYQFTTSDFEVKGVYSDGSRKDVAFSVTLSYSNGYYLADITSGAYTKQLKIKVAGTTETEDTAVTVTKMSYSLNPSYVYVGEDLAAGQLVVKATYSDNTEEIVTDYTCDFTPKDTAGEYNFTITWKDTVKQMTITVKEKTADVTLTALDAKYLNSFIYSDETPAKSDIVLTGTYSDGSSAAITDFDYSFTPASGHGEKATITISYAGNTLSINVMSYVKTEPKSVTFKYSQVPIGIGESINRDNITVEITDFAGNTSTVSDFSIDFEPKDTAGTYDFTVSYKGFSETFTVEVK